MQNVNSGGMTFYGGTFTGDTFNADTFNGGTFNGNAIGADTSGLTTAASAQITTLISSLTTLVADLEKLVSAGASHDTSSGWSGGRAATYGGSGTYDTAMQKASYAAGHQEKKLHQLFNHMI